MASQSTSNTQDAKDRLITQSLNNGDNQAFTLTNEGNAPEMIATLTSTYDQ